MIRTKELLMDEELWKLVEAGRWVPKHDWQATQRRLVGAIYGARHHEVGRLELLAQLERFVYARMAELLRGLDQCDHALSDDGLNDFTGHVVGCGQKKFAETLALIELGNGKRLAIESAPESFTYAMPEPRHFTTDPLVLLREHQEQRRRDHLAEAVGARVKRMVMTALQDSSVEVAQLEQSPIRHYVERGVAEALDVVLGEKP